MEYISAEKFLEQPQEVQEILLEWWKENIKQYDLFYRKLKGERQKYIITKVNGYELETITLRNKDKEIGRFAKAEGWNVRCIWDIIPLLTEGQLRKFIEKMTINKIKQRLGVETEILSNAILNSGGYYIGILQKYECKEEIRFHPYNMHETGSFDLLEAYWKVACRIIQED